MHHHTIQINQPTRCNSFTSLLLDIYVRLNMFRASPRPSPGAYNCTRSLWFYRWGVAVGALLVVVWPVIICQTTTNNAFLLQVYYLTSTCGSTCFGFLPSHHQEHTTALRASGFTVAKKRLERFLSWSDQL